VDLRGDLSVVFFHLLADIQVCQVAGKEVELIYGADDS
jgi:hypothetical protein